MPRLPQPGSDRGTWGDILNSFLLVEHNPDGTLDYGASLSAFATLNNPVFTGSVTVPQPYSSTDAVTKGYVDSAISAGAVDATVVTKGIVQLAGDLSGTAAAPTVPGLATKESSVVAGTTADYYRGDKTWQVLDKTVVGLSNVPNVDAASRSSHTGTQVAATISDFSSAVSGQSDVAANTAARHSHTNQASLDLVSGTNTGDQSTISGNAATATALQAPRLINGVAFDGTADITVADSTKVPTTTTVNGYALSSDVVVTKADVGLGNVDNTSDTTKNSATVTLTNKRITKRVGTTTSAASPAINTDNVDMYSLTAQAVDITSMSTNLSGTPTDGQTLWIVITGTAARAITWGASFEASTVVLPTTTVITNRLDVAFVWNAVTSKWRCVGVA